jgi:hypothetical protein
MLDQVREDAEQARWDADRNGMIIEQAQVITTRNLALLFGPLGLGETLRGELRDMSERCFRWICRRQQVKSDKWHATLTSSWLDSEAPRRRGSFTSSPGRIAIRGHRPD